MCQAVNKLDLIKDLEIISIPRHPIWDVFGYKKIQNYLYEKMSSYGRVEKHFFPSLKVDGCNLILKIEGKNSNLAPVLIGAHYDGVPNSPAADDNATAVAALLQLAKIFSAQSFPRSLWLVAFDQEEWGMRGSEALAKQLYYQNQSLHLMISLEMLGFTSQIQNYPRADMYQLFGGKGDYLALVGNNHILSLLTDINNIFSQYVTTKFLSVIDKGLSLPEIRLSDHCPFWELGYDGMMITDTAFLRNPHYHKHSDTIETLDLNFFFQVTQGLITMTKYLIYESL